ncbi:putative BPI/LBP family protein At1g04970 [Diospyros lotus]|uniref:putative BPI/LBP family protein At1g04970 n=1 Tax=Diospyros lotus TaxID=55363 RepID=UPI00225BF99B|nr:putative BPI/LBP family protein At1g04970 [Diospyros lotus]
MERNAFLLGLFILLVPSYTFVHSTEEGFVSVEIFRKGLNFAKDLLINKGISSLVPLELPEIEKSVKIKLLGTVHVTLSDIVLYEVDVNSSTVKLGNTGITIVASGAKAYLNMSWSYRYGSWIVISDSGVASVEVEGMEVGLTIDLENQQGNLKLSLLECGCYVKDVNLQLDGGASWLYQGLVGFFEKPLRSTIEDTVSQAIEDAIMELDPLLKSIPKEISIDNIATLNVTCINDLVYSNDSINFEIDGLFSARDKAVASKYNVRNSQASVSCESAAKMLGISIHEKVVNSASLVYFDADVMHWIIDKISDQSLLNTAEWKYVLPQLYKQYPNHDMNLNVSVTSPPTVKVAQQNIDAAIHLDVIIDVLDDGKVIPVACISTKITISAYPEISKNGLAGRVELNAFTMALEWSTIGNIHLNLVQPVVRTVLRTIVFPYVNLLLWKGIPLPSIRGFTLQNAEIGYKGPRIVVCSDVGSVKQQGFNPIMEF